MPEHESGPRLEGSGGPPSAVVWSLAFAINRVRLDRHMLQAASLLNVRQRLEFAYAAIASVLVSDTPAARICRSASASEPFKSMARQASRTTETEKPRRAASSAE